LRESVEGLSRVKHIVNDLKDFSRADEGEWQDADLNRGLESTLNVVWNELKYKAQVVREFAELPPVRCIPAQINQVFMNLLVNAAQAIETSGTISLRSGTTEEHAWVEVSDTGKGMPAEVRQRIFEPFFTTKPIGTGTGLGLSISADIMKRHNGGIEVQSEPGQGTTFRILLPLAARNADAPPAAA
jgi:two-component system, NtrC family, sensor kinase